MKAILIGASGATGKELLNLLINDQDVSNVVALVRRQLPIDHSKLTQVVVDFDHLEDWSDQIKGDVAFSCLGTTLRDAGSKAAQYKVDHNYQFAFAKLAKLNQVPTFMLVSSSSANPKSFFFYSRMKGELEQAVKNLTFEHFNIFRPGPLVRPQTDRQGENIGVTVISALNKLGILRNMAPLKVSRLAGLMLKLSKEPVSALRILESGEILKLTTNQ